MLVTLQFESGEALPFLVDTGSPMTLFDKSLESKLGECLGTDVLFNFGVKYEARRYAAPKLYIGSTPLVTDSNVLISDFVTKMSSGMDRPIMGILGMDCLRNYCIQLDFKAGRMRFLNPHRLKTAMLGKAFPLTFSNEGNSYLECVLPYIQHRHLVGEEHINLLIDTGHDLDGALEPEVFKRAIRAGALQVDADANNAREPENAYLRQCTWNGETYTDLIIGNGRNATESDHGENSLGLRFLARHLVTFDFPGRTMYLKRTSSGPFISRGLIVAGKAALRSATGLARKSMKDGRLPGWSKRDRGKFTVFHFSANPERLTFDTMKKGDSSTYHYEFVRASKDDPWKLKRAWKTDQDDHTIEEYRIQ